MADNLERRMPAPLLAPWAISPEGWELVAGVWSRGELFQDVVAKAHERWKAEGPSDGAQDKAGRSLLSVTDGIGVITVRGPLFRHAGLLSDISGAASYDAIWQAMEASLSDVNVKAILLRVNSPGGEVDGVGELADYIYASRGPKPIWTYYEQGASAAVWMGAQAERCIAYRGAEVGCIGVMAEGMDTSAAERAAGRIRKQWVSAATPAKRTVPLNDEVEARIQARIDAQCSLFVADLARGRGLTSEQVLERFGAGDLLIGAAALDAGLVDELGDFNSTLAALAAHASASTTPPTRSVGAHTNGAGLAARRPERSMAMADEPEKKNESTSAADQEDCKDCGGSGKVDGKDCATCNGSGKVAKTAKAEDDEPAHSEPDGDEAQGDEETTENAKALSALARETSATAATPVAILAAFRSKFVKAETVASLEKRLGATEQQLAAARREKVTAQAERAVDGWIAEGRTHADKRAHFVSMFVEAAAPAAAKDSAGEAACEAHLFAAKTFQPLDQAITSGGDPIGKPARPVNLAQADGDEIEQRMVAKANEIKARDKVTFAAALDKVRAEDPELYAAYRALHKR